MCVHRNYTFARGNFFVIFCVGSCSYSVVRKKQGISGSGVLHLWEFFFLGLLRPRVIHQKYTEKLTFKKIAQGLINELIWQLSEERLTIQNIIQLNFLFQRWLKFIGCLLWHPFIHPSIQPFPLWMLKQSHSSHSLLSAKLIWQVCIKAPDQYSLRAVRAKAKKNNTAASPALIADMKEKKNESWTLFHPLSIALQS